MFDKNHIFNNHFNIFNEEILSFVANHYELSFDFKFIQCSK